MGDDSRLTALTTACDDLEAQLEGGIRSIRRVDDDLTEIGAVLASVSDHSSAFAGVIKHMRELRANMAEQRNALREVRAADEDLCASLARTQEERLRLGEERGSADSTRAGDATTVRTHGGAAIRRAAGNTASRPPARGLTSRGDRSAVNPRWPRIRHQQVADGLRLRFELA